MNFFKRLFCSYDHEDGTNHQWSKWERITFDVKQVLRLTGQILEGKQDGQRRRCSTCGKFEEEELK